MPDRLYEDCPRFIRQRLLALEEGREDDAEALLAFIASEFGVTAVDVHASELKRTLIDRWRARFGLPWFFDLELVEKVKPLLLALEDPEADHAAVREELRATYGIVNAEPGVYAVVTKPENQRLSVMREAANEPIWRIPEGIVSRAPSNFETPLHVLSDYIMPWDDEDMWSHPEPHLRPRSKNRDGAVRPLPPKVASAIRVWAPSE